METTNRQEKPYGSGKYSVYNGYKGVSYETYYNRPLPGSKGWWG